MKLSQRSGAFLCLTAALAGTVAAEVQDTVLFRVPSVYKYRYETVVTRTALDAAPHWPEDQAHPPLAPRKAIELAREQLLKMHAESTNWNLRGVDLMQIGREGQWMYSVRFAVPQPSPQLIPTPFDIIVLMNGVVVQPVPTLTPEDINFFGFDKTRLRQVLEYYKQLTGRILMIDDDVPQDTATITSSRRPLRKAEAALFIEQELRDQAGVIFVPIGTKGSRVTYDRKAKRAAP